MIDVTADDLYMQLYILSAQATVQLHEQVNGILEIYTDMS